MRISEFIDNLDIDSLANLVEQFSLNIAPVTRNKIKKYFNEIKDFHEIILNSYDECERRKIFEFYVEYYEQTFIEIPEIKILNDEMLGKESILGVPELIANLWGYIVKDGDVEHFKFFDDAFSMLNNNFINKIVSDIETPNDTTLGNLIINNIDSFIEVVSSDKYKYIKIGVSKKICKDVILKTTIKTNSEVEFIFYFLDSINIIHKSTLGGIVVSEENMHWWLTTDVENKIRIINKFTTSDFLLKKFVEFSKKDIIYLQFIFSFPNKKISIDAVEELCIVDIVKFKYVIEVFNEIGLLKVKDNFFVFNLQANSNPSETVDNFMYVQPNYEITTSFLLPSEKKIFILKFAELKSKDSAVVYQITKISIIKGFHYGLKAEEIIEFLESNSISPVPQNIEFSINDWYKLYSSIKLEKVNLLTVTDDFLLNKVMSIHRFKKLVIGEVSKNHLIVSNFDKAKLILIQEEILLEDFKIMKNDEEIKENIEVDITYRKKDSEEIYIPRNIKKFINTNRLYTATSEQKILAIKYCLTKELNIEVLYDDAEDRVLNNKKLELQPIEISDMWENPDVIVYSSEYKKNYSINVKNIKRFRILLKN